MRKKIIAGNWKMHKDAGSARTLVTALRDMLAGSETSSLVEVIVCPPYPFLGMAVETLSGSGIGTGAQNLHQETQGAYTGEVSGAAIRSIGAEYVIVGHSERRQYFHETDALVNAKIKAALGAGLRPVVCVGELLEDREAGNTLAVVDRQVHGALEDIPAEAMENIVLAYEPVWAIGTGKTATPEQAQEVHAQIRARIEALYSKQIAGSMRILYGGSMKPANAADLLCQPDVDGGLIGGACLESASFVSIIEAAVAARQEER